MFDVADLVLFISAGLILNLTPGPDMLFCMGQGIASGPRAGIVAALGISTGAAIHTILAALGLAALLVANPIAFDMLRWAGVIYLVYMAAQMFRGGATVIGAGKIRKGLVSVWRDATIVNLLNPKVIVFILAFLPQFVDPTRGNPIVQFLLLGLIFNVVGTIVTAAAGGIAGLLGQRVAQGGKFANLVGWAGGSLMLVLAGRMAFDR